MNALRLLSIEFYKLKYSKAARLILLAYFGLLTSIALVAALKFQLGPIEIKLADQGIFEFPFIWHFNSYIASVFKLFLLILIVSMVANEYSNRTLKQNLIDGMSKKEYILSKFYMALALAVVSTVFVFIVSLVIGLFYSSDISLGTIFSEWSYLFAYFIKLTTLFSLGIFMAMVVKRSAFALGAMFVWYIVEKIIFVISVINFSEKTTNTIGYFFPFSAMEKIIPPPFLRMKAIQDMSTQMGQEIVHNFDIRTASVFSGIIWTGIFIYGSYLLLKKRDL